MGNDKRVVVTGIGPLASTGHGKDAFWRGIVEGNPGLMLEEMRIDDEEWDKFYLHKVRDFNIYDYNVQKSVVDDINTWKKGREDRDLLYILAAVRLALDDSSLSYDHDNNNIGLFLTIEHPGFEPFCEGLVRETISYIEHNPLNNNFSKSRLFRHIYKQVAPQGYDLQTFMYLHLIAKAFSFHGYSLFTNNACASGLYALESAARQIRYGDSNVVVLAGGDVADTMFKHLWFKERGLYADDGKMKPFSRDANGIVLGDGASAIILEDMEYALNRNAHIYAEYKGGGFSLEGWKVTLPQIGSLSYQKAINSALEKTDTKPDDIDLINPHGVALKVTDGYEAKAISDIFGDNDNSPFISAFKPYVGHNLGGSAVLECIILLLSLENNMMLPTLHCEEKAPQYNIRLVNELTDQRLNTVMKLSCGFAGYNAAAIFKKLD